MKTSLFYCFMMVVGLLTLAGCSDRGGDVDGGLIPFLDGGVDASTMTCEPGMVDCGGACSRVAEDSNNCGSCGNVCPTGLTCAVGRCDCSEPMKACDGVCLDTDSDAMNCGSCGNVCAMGEGCVGGECVMNCDDPSVRCENTAEDGSPLYVCADVQTDPVNCGSCNTTCSGSAVCAEGRCGCADEQVSCSGTCSDLTTDPNNCGACLNSCGADGVCMAGACSTCGTDLTACGAPRRCVDTESSRLHCGACDNACGPGATCTTGACECLAGLVTCDGVCSNLDTNSHNCGGCGIDCGVGGSCMAGVCSCAAAATMCGAECAVLSEDHDHCGSCAVACDADETCVSGACLVLNNSCATAFTITANAMIADEEIADGGAAPTGATCGFGTGNKALFYRITIPAGQEVAVTTDSSADLVLFELASCAAADCTRYSDFPESLTLTNLSASAVTRIVGVRTYSSTASAAATYDIAFAYSTPVVAPNASCTTATAITANMSITGENIAEGGPRPTGTGCGFGSGDKALYYSVTIPAGQQVAVTTTTSADLVLFEQAACADLTCTMYSDFPKSLTLMNTGTSAVTRIVGVRTYFLAPSSPIYDIQFAYSTP